MTPEEAEDLMNPFYPNDPYLAIRTLSREIGEEATVPEWILESIVHQYFQFLSMEKMQKKQEETISNYTDPYKTILPKMKTVPYILTVELPWMN